MKTAIYKDSIEKRISQLIFSLVFIIILTAYVIFTFWYLNNEKNERITLSKGVTKILSQDFLRLILIDEINVASDLTKKLQAFPKIQKVILYNNKDKKIYLYQADIPQESLNIFTQSTPLNYQGKQYGKVYFEFKIESIWEIFLDNIKILFLSLLVFLSLSYILVRLYSAYFTTPLLHLVNFLEKIEFNDHMKHYKIKNPYKDEFGKLYEEINIMLNNINTFLKEKKEAKKQLTLMQRYDGLTGFLNKRGFINSIKNILGKEKDSWSALFYIKVTNLSTINHVYSYQEGDYILKELAKKIKDAFSDSKLNAYVGSGNFILFYKKDIFQDKETLLKETKNIADALVTLLSQTIQHKEKEFTPEIYVGIDLFYAHKDPLEAMKHSHIALQTGKEKEQKIFYYDPKNELQIKEYFNIFKELNDALQNDQLELYYQLQYGTKENIIGTEALIRWNHPKFGLLTPYKFIPIAERTDLIIKIGEWVIENACKQLQLWQKNEKTKDWTISVNVSAKQFYKQSFIPHLKTTIAMYKVDPHKIKLELLESLFVKNQQEVSDKMNTLKTIGFQLSLDDFGTGFSSLQYLKAFPLDQIKIDQSFVINMFKNEKDIKIIKTILYLGNLLEMNVIAEGVEEKQHYEKLKKLGCHHFQGYYLAKPQSIDYINKYILKS